MSIVRLSRDFYRRHPVAVARALLGQRLVHHGRDGGAEEVVTGIIVETEAYLGECDRAAHSFDGRRTGRTETMYADGGTAYVFLNYGLHRLFNVVTSRVDVPQAVLIRAVQPERGLDLMFARRPSARRAGDLCSGPGKLGAAFGIELVHDGVDLVESETLYIEQVRKRALPDKQIQVSPRIGVEYAGSWAQAPLRFHIAGNPHVSK